MAFHVTVNNVPVPAVAINNVTYVEVIPSEQALGINFSITPWDKTDWGTPFEDVKGVIIDGNLYTPWYTLAQNIHAEHIPGGWNFDTVDNVITATPVLLQYDAVWFWANNGTIPFQLDTGAFEPYLNADTAAKLNVVNLGPAPSVGGVGGLVSDAYLGVIPYLTIGHQTFTNIPCVVSPSWNQTSLFGYRFFFDNKFSLYIDRNNFTLDIIK